MFMFNFMDAIFPILFLGMFGLIFGLMISTFTRHRKQERKNDASPRLASEATVVTKRHHVWGDHSRTDYYATFPFESGDRLELKIPHDRFGYLVEGDSGKLHFQGTRFLDFQRQ